MQGVKGAPALPRVFRIAVDRGGMTDNPCRNVNVLNGQQHRTRYLTPDEEGRLMASLEIRSNFLSVF